MTTTHLEGITSCQESKMIVSANLAASFHDLAHVLDLSFTIGETIGRGAAFCLAEWSRCLMRLGKRYDVWR